MPDKESGQPVQQQTQGQTPPVPLPENHPTGLNTAEVREQQDENRITNLEGRMGRAEKIMAWLTGAIALFALASVIVGFLQWSVMDNQLTLTRQQLVGTQAAVLKISRSFDIEGFVLGLTNIRDVDATQVYIKTVMTPVSLPDETALGSPVFHERRLPRIEKDNPFAERSPIPWPLQGAMQEGWPGNRSVKIDTEYSYEDGFGTKISGSFCDMWLPILTITTKRENATVGGAIPCDGIENTIRDISARKQEAEAEKKKNLPN
jgi:hypothetical protein